MDSETRTIGKPEIRKDAWEKVGGSAQYVADIPAKDLRYGAVLRSPHHHARILNIDPQAAKSQPGVIAVLTAFDLPGCRAIGPLVEDRPVLAWEVVRHIGEPVALVVAESRAAAERALAAIQVEYEPLPAVFDAIEALEPGAPRLQPDGNLLVEYEVSDGDLQAGFAGADLVIEEQFSVPRISPAYMEPEAALAVFNADGSLTVWVSSQKPFVDRKDIAKVLGLQEADVQVVSAVIGGAFGGKEDSGIAILAAFGAWASHASVQLVNNRHESFLAHPKRHPAHLRLKLGARRDGSLMALEAVIHLDTGAYASYGPAVGQLLTEVVPGAYHIPNVRVNTRVIYTNSPFSGAMRGFGSPQAHFALESLLDMLAIRLEMDPLELRRKNILQPGDRLFTQVMVKDTAKSLPQCLEHVAAVRERLGQVQPAPGKVSGVGLAFAAQSMGLGNRVPDDSTNKLEWLPDGQVRLYLGAPDLGQGLATVAEQIIAEEMGLPFDHIRTIGPDTRLTLDGGVTCASRMTYLVGNSVKLAARELIRSLLDYAARSLRVPPQDLMYQAGKVLLPDGSQIPVQEFTGRAADQGSVLQAQATFSFPYPIESTPQHLPIGMPHVMFVFGAQVARVEVDPELGTVEVKDLVAIHDVGRIINRAGVEGQIEGGVAMGIGYALFENVRLKENGKWVESFTEYLLPTSKDVPASIECIILEVPEQSGPYGAKGIAEISIVPTAPAIANAVFDATGVRLTSIPITPEMIVMQSEVA